MIQTNTNLRDVKKSVTADNDILTRENLARCLDLFSSLGMSGNATYYIKFGGNSNLMQ